MSPVNAKCSVNYAFGTPTKGGTPPYLLLFCNIFFINVKRANTLCNQIALTIWASKNAGWFPRTVASLHLRSKAVLIMGNPDEEDFLARIINPEDER